MVETLLPTKYSILLHLNAQGRSMRILLHSVLEYLDKRLQVGPKLPHSQLAYFRFNNGIADRNYVDYLLGGTPEVLFVWI